MPALEDATNIEIIPMALFPASYSVPSSLTSLPAQSSKVSAVHVNPIYCCCATKNSKWLFTGSEDGFIRKYDLFSSLNGVTTLTGVQKQGLADSIQKGGSIISAWENDDSGSLTSSTVKKEGAVGAAGSNTTTIPAAAIDASASTISLPDASKTSPVYSLDVQAEGIWLVGGTESGSINLWSVRHEEGKVQHVFKGGHKSPVSVLKISPAGDKTIMSGSWDKTLRLWSLETGAQISVYTAADHPGGSSGYLTSHLTSLAITPSCPSLYLCSTYDGNVYAYDTRKKDGLVFKILPQASQAPPWTLSACWGGGGLTEFNKIFVGRRNGCVDEFDLKMASSFSGSTSHKRTLKMPHGSGSVYAVESLPNNRHLLVGSYDNIRLWDLEHQSIENNSTSNTLKDKGQDDVGNGLDLMRNSMMGGSIEEDAFDMGLFGNQNIIAKQGAKNGNDEMMMLDQDLLIPSVPFTIVPGHHGGVLSCLLLTGSYLVSTSGNKGYDGNSNNLCLIYDIQKSQPNLQATNTSS